MERRDKDSHPFIFDFAYSQITSYVTYPYLNLGIILLQHFIFLAKFYELIQPGYFGSLFSSFTFFLILVACLVVFVALTFISYNLNLLTTIWVYLLLILEALQMIYIEMSLQCFAGSRWCGSDIKLQLSCLTVAVLFCVIIAVRSYCYCPFHETDNPLSMSTGRNILYTFIYAICISLATNQILSASSSASRQIGFLVTMAFFAITSEPPTSSPLISRGLFICGVSLLWTSGLIWLIPLLSQVIGVEAGSIWFYWGFSTPIVIGLSWMFSRKFRKGYEWRSLFYQSRNQTLRELFLQVNQLIKFLEVIKKSQLHTNGAEFLTLWGLIADHNEKCKLPECPLHCIESLRIRREDELLQQKRFNRTIQKTLEFALQKLTSQHDNYPNLLELSQEIANFQLQVFHLRTKGLQLYSREYGKGRSSAEQWGIFFLKRKIEGFQGSGEVGLGQKQQEIESFKHSIQLSVSMLAEFWYFLSDPKCNIKKLYDLANVLFPLKIGVDESWQRVKKLKNIESYYLYARYLVKMFNDKDKGIQILEDARRLEIEAHEREEILVGSEGATSEQHGVIFLEFDGKNSGIMYQVNNSCEKMFGYNKGELQGRKVNDIMPKLFAIYHDRILENYQQTNRPRMMNKDRAIWGRSKDGYLFPFTICIKPVRNYFSQTSEVYASLKRDLWLKEKAFFFIDSEYHLTDLSASTILLYPDIAARIHLKKKIHASEIIPEIKDVLPRLIHQKESYEQIITRTYAISTTETFTETTTFNIQAEEVSVGVAGTIGYYFKVFKGTGLTSYDPKAYEDESRVGYSRDPRREFRFIANIQEGGKQLIYQGGISENSGQVRSQMLSRISNFIQEERQMNNIELMTIERIDYGKDIKTKRLQATMIREIHELSEDSELNRAIGPDSQEQEGDSAEIIKPRELNSILQRETGNRPIIILKILTILMLSTSILLSVLEYISIYQNKSSIGSSLSTYSALTSIQAQIATLNQLANCLYINSTAVGVSSLGVETNLLDSLTPNLPININIGVFYNDGSSQSMLLSFAINKLISEAQAVAEGTGGASQMFFLQYNTVNGLLIGCEEALSQLGRDLNGSVGKGTTECVIYLIICCCVFAVILIAKNIVLRQVLLKKAEILNIFFEIPRYSCSSIQKECQRFIQRLTADNNDEDLEIQGNQPDDHQDSSSKRHGQQKKRTIMGEEKTSTNFIVVSLLMLAFLLIYPILALSVASSSSQKDSFMIDAGIEFLAIEKDLSVLRSLMNTHLIRTDFLLEQSTDGWSVITKQYNLVQQMLTSITANFFLTGKILDQQYLDSYNQIFFESLCTGGSASSCNTALGEDKGFNNVLYNHYDYLISKYQLVQAATVPYNLTAVFPTATQLLQEDYRALMKKYCREMETMVVSGIKRLVLEDDGLLFGVMLAICLVGSTVLMYAWISFYNSLQKKILATEYILTFIPIDEINKNTKIARYIKEQVLRIN